MLVQFEVEIPQMDIDRYHLTEEIILMQAEERCRTEMMDMILKVAPIKKLNGPRPNHYGNQVCILSPKQFFKIADVIARIKKNSGSKQTQEDCDMVLEQLKNVFGDGK